MRNHIFQKGDFMYRKICDRCDRPSYSSSEIGKWICPECNNDLTRNPFFEAMTLERVFVKLFLNNDTAEKYHTNK